MRAYPSPNSNQSKLCVGCGLTFARRDCHRNRYGEYFCRACQAGGVRSTRLVRLRHGYARVLSRFWIGAALVVGVATVIWILYAVGVHLSIAPKFLHGLFW